ncbi:hypothetical protein ACFQ1E_02215 [Sphingomonas canadensis]|uniref:Rap1a immunity protein domain-containing protein n=1 Tax=Sphingomonas canadensis TaxID=1219257 RepID=A0ABW3H114_9SPHN|nr:hypothetical protein [Sphingomonas canadensis]MCW3834944.1 hypothetical protein [Sphingomonas canadensis]
MPFVTALVLALAPVAPQAIDPQDRADAICTLAMSNKSDALADSDPAMSEKMAGIMMFYVGKLFGRHDGPAVRALLNAVDADAGAEAIEAAGRSCVEGVSAAAAVLQDE